ncbi:hypothetical protein GCM10011348_40780 [Marinobacterium nitratireducens]|uniref:DUF2254 domain-containing protein n=1 Tax=Marinobacterium nitratireducens TaxID=518897 RepID=A0A918DWX3_9GAMM|nr:DUF2254 domain-containing protein [Marinobacterium nitratireducens]GGO87483.1 hypothetical protein GCM10011348_40780 [Marinobacterium nitratireducens]
MQLLSSKWIFLACQQMRRLWFRASLYCLVAVITALLSALVDERIPGTLATFVGADSVGNLLGILAASMLTVATFSLSTLVASYSAAASSATPRATRLLVEDSAAQNALATFIGAFLFAVVGIIALSSGIYGNGGRLVLLLVTVIVVALVVVTLLRWIDQLLNLGRVGETVRRVEAVTCEALLQRACNPGCGARLQLDPPTEGFEVRPRSVGYIQHVDLGSLQEFCEELDCRVSVLAMPGCAVEPTRALLRVSREPDDDSAQRLRDAFVIGSERTFEQDPGFGFVVLGEIAARALSPAVNDPGTAIDVIQTGLRLLVFWAENGHKDENPEVSFPDIRVPPPSESQWFDGLYTVIAREGAAQVEVMETLLRSFATLERLQQEAYREPLRQQVERALRFAQARMTHPDDVQRVRDSAPSLPGH